MKKVTVKDIVDRKGGEKITCLTAYDYAFAGLLDRAGVDILLVGDSLGMVVLGYDSTVPVTMREMLHHTKAVTRAAERALVVADMPFASFQRSVDGAVRNAARFLKEAGAHAVKVEGPVTEVVRALACASIPVMGHVGLTPQSAGQLGGYRVQGRTRRDSDRILEEAKALAHAGAFAVVLECVPHQLAREITRAIPVPTIGIGAGPHCDGQVLVTHDLLGLEERLRPRFVRRYAEFGALTLDAVRRYCEDVRQGHFPTLDESFETKASATKEPSR